MEGGAPCWSMVGRLDDRHASEWGYSRSCKLPDRFNQWISLNIPLKAHRRVIRRWERGIKTGCLAMQIYTMLKGYYTALVAALRPFHFAIGVFNVFVKDAQSHSGFLQKAPLSTQTRFNQDSLTTPSDHILASTIHASSSCFDTANPHKFAMSTSRTFPAL